MGVSPKFFLFFRRGIPLACIGLSLAIIVLHPDSLGWVLIVCMALLAELGTTFHTGKLYLSKRQPILRWDGYWLRTLRPIFKSIGMEDRWLRSFCAWNNKRISHAFRTNKAQKTIVLLSHCIQAIKCKISVIECSTSCLKCGKCPLDAAVRTAETNGWDMRVSPRSRAAYVEARKAAPDILIAVACADRLVKGLIKLPEIPSYVIPLELPHGMCVDTTFDFQHLQQAVNILTAPNAALNIKPLQVNAG